MANRRILLSPPDVGLAEETAAREAISSGWVAPAGPHLDDFEKFVAKAAGRSHAVALSSGTAALHLGLLSLGVREHDYVICSSLTFVATANAIRYIGAIPVFVDSDKRDGNISPVLVESAILELRQSGHNVSALIPVDFLGSVANYSELLPMGSKYNIAVLADAAESLGASRDGRPAGSFGDAGVFSFNGNKIATTSGGGAFLSDDRKLVDHVRYLSTQARDRVKHYEHQTLGYNYRLSNVLAAIGCAQLGRLPEFVRRRRQIRSKYRALFEDVQGVQVLGVADDEDNCWLTAILVDPEQAGFTAGELSEHLESVFIETRPLWKPMHLQPLYRANRSFTDGTAENFYLNGLALPSGSTLADSDFGRIAEEILAFVGSCLGD